MATGGTMRRVVGRWVSLARTRSTEASVLTCDSATSDEVKSFEDMPEKKFAFGLAEGLYKTVKNKNRLHEVWREDGIKYGPVYKEVGHIPSVHVAGSKALEDAYRCLDKYPIRPDEAVRPWQLYRNIKSESQGLLTSQNEEWHKYRHAVADKILKSDILTSFDGEVNDIITDFIERLEKIRDEDDMTIPLLTNEFYKWAMETICSFLYEQRLGSLEDAMPPRTQEFIDAVEDMFVTTFFTSIYTDFHVKWNTKPWKRHCAAWDTIFSIARYYTDKKLNELADLHKKGNIGHGKGSFLKKLIASEQLTNKEIYANTTELMLAGVDTTSNTMCFTLCHLAENPDVQRKLQNEVDSVLEGRIPTGSDLTKMPFLKMVIKESMRMSPVVPLHPRTISRDVVIGGYRVPAKTMLVMHAYYANDDVKDPNEFRPDRWDRTNDKLPHPFTSLPFSYGTRGCIGRRLAELELHMLLARITQRFEIKTSNRYQLEPRYRGILTPGKNLPLRLIDRK